MSKPDFLGVFALALLIAAPIVLVAALKSEMQKVEVLEAKVQQCAEVNNGVHAKEN